MRRRPRKQGHGFFRQFFLSVAPDVVHLLFVQGNLSLDAMRSFAHWSSTGDIEELHAMREAARQAYEARRTLLSALRSALATPIDQEDLYILSERCDRVVRACRDLVAEADALGWAPDEHAAGMAGHLLGAMEHLVGGFSDLRRNPDQAGAAADRATAETREVVRAYRQAMRSLLATHDIDVAFTGREMYRSYARAADLTTAVADRLWYAVIAEA